MIAGPLGGVAAVDELALVVVGERDVLRRAEGLERVPRAVVGLVQGEGPAAMKTSLKTARTMPSLRNRPIIGVAPFLSSLALVLMRLRPLSVPAARPAPCRMAR